MASGCRRMRGSNSYQQPSTISGEAQAALKVLYLVATEHRPNRSNPTGKINGWKTILNALTIHYGDRITAAN